MSRCAALTCEILVLEFEDLPVFKTTFVLNEGQF